VERKKVGIREDGQGRGSAEPRIIACVAADWLSVCEMGLFDILESSAVLPKAASRDNLRFIVTIYDGMNIQAQASPADCPHATLHTGY